MQSWRCVWAHIKVLRVLQDMSIDVYGRKEEDAPQQETASSSNGVRNLT